MLHKFWYFSLPCQHGGHLFLIFYSSAVIAKIKLAFSHMTRIVPIFPAQSDDLLKDITCPYKLASHYVFTHISGQNSGSLFLVICLGSWTFWEDFFFPTLKSIALAGPKFSIDLVNLKWHFEWVYLVAFGTSASRETPRIITENLVIS